MLKVWNMLLVILAFCLSIFGTFLTRSGVVNSIHSFTESPLGPWFLGFICFVTAGSLALVFWRLPLLRSKTRLESLVSREAAFLYNNLLLVALCLTILWGVAFPILSELVRGETRTIGRPYYDFFLRTFGLPLLLLMGIGPLIAWRRASLRSLGRTFIWPAGDRASPSASCCSRSARARRRRGSSRTRSARSCWRRSCSSSCAARARPDRSRSSSRGTGAGTAATSCTRRSSCSRSASQARARTARRPSGSSRRGSR